MTRFFLAIALLPISAGAEEANVRAGEHPTFSRLVIDKPEYSPWNLSKSDSGYSLKIDGITDYDTDDVFGRIPQGRISGLSSGSRSDELKIAVSCDCHANAFLWRQDKLVVDIKDGPPPADSAFEMPDRREARQVQLPLVTANLESEMHPELSLEPLPPLPIRMDNREQLSELEKVIVESLARGAAQGLLDPTESLASGAEHSFGVVGAHLNTHFENNQPGVLAHTSMDFGASLEDGADTEKEGCFPESNFEIASWAAGEGFNSDIANARSMITGEFDAIDSAAVTNLAKTYLHYGFGREAIATLLTDADMSQERLILTEIGSILDDQSIERPVLGGQIGCETNSAFWGYLANGRPKVAESERNAILRGFRSLPESLQLLLGPRLSQRFTASNDYEAAEMVLSANQMEDTSSTDLNLAHASIQTKQGDIVAAQTTLENVVETDARLGPEPLIEYLKLAIQTGTNIDPERLALADILRFEYQDSDIVGQLAATQIDALIAINDFDKAFVVLDAEAKNIDNLDFERLQESAIVGAVKDYSDPKFLELAFSGRAENTTAQAQNSISARLLTSGLAERADFLVAGPAKGGDMQERRYLRAEAAIELDMKSRALESLVGITTERANLLRQKAELLGLEEIAPSAAGDDWRLGNWSELAQGSDEFLRTVSSSVLDQTQLGQAAGPVLGDGRDLLAKSEESRILIEQLLSRYAPVSE